MPKQFWHTLHNSAVPELQICRLEQKKEYHNPGWDPSALPSALQTRSAVRRVVWALESEAGNKVRGHLNPLLVRLSVQPLVHPVRAPSALIRLSASPPVRLHSPCRPLVHPSASILRAVRLPARRSPPVRPPSTPVRISQKLPTVLFWS